MGADAEAVRKALQSALKSDQFNAMLQAIFVEKNDVDRFEPPKEVYDSEQPMPQIFPCGEIVIGRGTKNNPESAAHDVTFEAVLYWHVDGAGDTSRMEDLLSRYVRATQDFFKVRPNLLPWLGSVSVWTGDDDYSPLVQHENVLIKSAAVAVFGRTQR